MEEYIKRHIDLNKILEKRSVILLGPRMTGKSMYAKKELKNSCFKIESSFQCSLLQSLTESSIIGGYIKSPEIDWGTRGNWWNTESPRFALHCSSIYWRYRSCFLYDRFQCKEIKEKWRESFRSPGSG